MGVHRRHVRHPGPLPFVPLTTGLVAIAARTADGAVAIAWGRILDEEEVMIRMRRWRENGWSPGGVLEQVWITEWRLFGLILLLRRKEYEAR